MTTVPRLDVVRVDPQDPDQRMLHDAAAALRRGGLVAFPTETVYGLGANALDADAVAGVFRAKGRPADNPLIVHLADPSDLPRLARAVPPTAAALAEQWWPGPLTLVLDARPDVPAITTGGHATVGVRVPDHPVARALIAAAGVPVAAPSANRSGRPSPTSADHVIADLGGALDTIVDGGTCAVGVESTVVDARGDHPIVLREGAVTREDLAATGHDGPTATAPGTRYRHYAPDCAVTIADDVAAGAAELTRAGRRPGVVAPAGTTVPPGVKTLATYRDLPELARVLYHALRDAEAGDIDITVLPRVPPHGLGRAVADRIARAAGQV